MPAKNSKKFPHGTLQRQSMAASLVMSWSVFSVVALACSAAFGQTDASLATTWRVTSRLGYGPTAATAQAVQPDAKAWALQQIDAAYSTSQRPPSIPAELSRFNAPLNDIARDFHAEREARRNLREQSTATAPQAGVTNLPANAADGQGFSREMQQTAAAWRLMSCSDPTMENPLLARMTEFWFNHLNVFVEIGRASCRERV